MLHEQPLSAAALPPMPSVWSGYGTALPPPSGTNDYGGWGPHGCGVPSSMLHPSSMHSSQHGQHLEEVSAEHQRREDEKKRLKRVANRKSAYSSRARKKQHVEEMSNANRDMQQHAHILDLLPDLILGVDRSGDISFVSQSVSRKLHYTAPQLWGGSILDLVTPESRPVLTAVLRRHHIRQSASQRLAAGRHEEASEKSSDDGQGSNSNGSALDGSQHSGSRSADGSNELESATRSLGDKRPRGGSHGGPTGHVVSRGESVDATTVLPGLEGSLAMMRGPSCSSSSGGGGSSGDNGSGDNGSGENGGSSGHLDSAASEDAQTSGESSKVTSSSIGSMHSQDELSSSGASNLTASNGAASPLVNNSSCNSRPLGLTLVPDDCMSYSTAGSAATTSSTHSSTATLDQEGGNGNGANLPIAATTSSNIVPAKYGHGSSNELVDESSVGESRASSNSGRASDGESTESHDPPDSSDEGAGEKSGPSRNGNGTSGAARDQSASHAGATGGSSGADPMTSSAGGGSGGSSSNGGKQKTFATWSTVNLQRHNEEIDQQNEQAVWTLCLVRPDRTTLWCEANSNFSGQAQGAAEGGGGAQDGSGAPVAEVIFSLRPVRDGNPMPASFVLITEKKKSKKKVKKGQQDSGGPSAVSASSGAASSSAAVSASSVAPAPKRGASSAKAASNAGSCTGGAAKAKKAAAPKAVSASGKRSTGKGKMAAKTAALSNGASAGESKASSVPPSSQAINGSAPQTDDWSAAETLLGLMGVLNGGNS